MFHIQTADLIGAESAGEDVMSAGRRKKHLRRLPVMLEYLIESLEQQRPAERPGAADALRAFGHFAMRELPGRGAFAGDQPELYQAIEQIADQHLGLGIPRRAFFAATKLVADSELRDRIESNANHMQTISDQAYFYAGLAFGVTLARFGWPW